jgi:lipopolysaccharide transport system ATP-binding protein
MTGDIAIRARGLGKKYIIGKYQDKRPTFRDAFVNSIKAPFRRLTQKGADQSPKEFWALKDVSFDVNKGEVLGIIGRNGAGKSTLLKILSRITLPTEGEVDIYGRVGSLLEVGTGFHPELTGRENIFLSGSILGMRKREIEEKFDEIVQFSEIKNFIDTPVKRYSSGMYVRLAFSVAAHLEPEILIVDEVLAVGDASFQKKCLGKMGDVAKEGRTVLFVSHNMAAVQQLCSKVMLLKDGKNSGIFETSEGIGNYLSSIENYTPGVSISSRTDREGNGNIRIVDAWVSLADGIKTDSILQDRNGLIFHLITESLNETRNVRISFGVYHSFKSCILWLDSNVINDNRTLKMGKNYIKCTLAQNFALAKGNYKINIAIWDSHGMADHLKSAFFFNVIDGDFFGTGKIAEGDPSIIAFQEWTIE